EGRQFKDVQIEGPFARWEHTHSIEPDGTDACFLEDRIEYDVPLGAVGRACGGPFVRAMLRRVFDYRHRVKIADLRSHNRAPGVAAMRILVTGSTGLIGSALVPFLTTGGHEVTRLVRPGSSAAKTEGIEWDSAAGRLDAAKLEAFDAVVHLAG